MVANDFLNQGAPLGLWLMSPPTWLLSFIQEPFTSGKSGTTNAELRKSEGDQDLNGHETNIQSSSLIDALLVDFDLQGKAVRQERATKLLGHATTISENGEEILKRALANPFAPIFVRLGRFNGEQTLSQIRDFQERGVSGFLLSMVEHESEIDEARRVLAPGVALGAMIETPEAVARIALLRKSGLEFAFVGLVDLAIRRGTPSIFTPLIDGSMDEIAESLAGIPFGFGAATTVGGGSPIPNHLLLSEMLRHGACFTLLRSAFYRDVRELDIMNELGSLKASISRLHRKKNQITKNFSLLQGLLEKTP